ncbi:unnamed protein product, partial [marine sediment metagenome]
MSQSFRYEPAMYLDNVCSPAQFPNHVRDSFSRYVGILIRNRDYELMDKEISRRILEKNRELNLKSSQELLLIDKQGLLYATPTSD